jgi:hypothetical protein
MARFTTLSTLYTMLQARLGENSSFTQTKARYYQLISDKQKWLASEYDWPYLEDRFDVAIPAGGRYAAFPTIDNLGYTTAMNMERPYKAEVFWNNVWSELDYGIGSNEFNYLNSDSHSPMPNGPLIYQTPQAQDPIQRWRWSYYKDPITNAATTWFEIWPIPTTSQVVRFTGQRALDTLAADGDTADLDDELLVLSVAADLLFRSKQADASLVAGQAAERLRAVRASYPTKPKGIVFGGRDEREDKRRLIPIAVAGNK